MSRIDDMIHQMCPDGVEYKPLGDVGTFFRGNGLQKKDFVEEGLPCIHYGQIHTLFGIATDSTTSSVAPALWNRLRHAIHGDLLIATTSEDDTAVAKATTWLGDNEIAIGGDLYVFRHKLDPKYVSHFFSSSRFQNQKSKFISGAKMRRISGLNLSKIRIPVPPFSLQHEIVTILDKFVALEAGLEAELEARRQQYAYYRNHLIWESNAPRVALGNVGALTRGRRFTRNDIADQGVPAIHYGEIYTTYGISTRKTISHVASERAQSLRYAEPGDVIIAGVGETVEEVGIGVAWLGNHPVAYHDDSFALHHQQDPRYISHVLRTSDYHRQKDRFVSRAKVKRLSARGIEQITIPLPPLSEQRRIADILGNFDSLVSDISSGIPAEIEARRQQYEYYRDRLLTFPEKAV